MKTKWIVIGVLSVITIILLGSGAAPLIFSEIVYGCNLQKKMSLSEIDEVTEHKITQEYLKKYQDSASTNRSRSIEWGYGIVEYSSSHYESYGIDGWTSAHLKVIVDQCGIPQEFEFQCMDNRSKQVLTSVNSKNDDLMKYLQNESCFDVTNQT